MLSPLTHFAQLILTKYRICHGGDPAQVQMRRHYDFSRLFFCARWPELDFDGAGRWHWEKKLKQVVHLLVNYRTTNDILMMGNQILATARAFFPGAIDFAKPEIARKDLGLKVALCSWKAAFKAKSKFDEDQAFIYSSNKPGDLLRDVTVWLDNHPFILSSLESKDLEFLDIGEQPQTMPGLWDDVI